jgi:hypothetical protein
MSFGVRLDCEANGIHQQSIGSYELQQKIANTFMHPDKDLLAGQFAAGIAVTQPTDKISAAQIFALQQNGLGIAQRSREEKTHLFYMAKIMANYSAVRQV